MKSTSLIGKAMADPLLANHLDLDLLRPRVQLDDAEAADLPRPRRLAFRGTRAGPRAAFPFRGQHRRKRSDVGLGLGRLLLRGTRLRAGDFAGHLDRKSTRLN